MKIIDRIIILTIVMSAAAACSPKQGAHIRSTKEGFELTVDGSPVFIKGIGGTNRPDIAVASGANACRTWGGSIDDMAATMAMAAENGLYVMQGIWLPKEAEKYADEETVMNMVLEAGADDVQDNDDTWEVRTAMADFNTVRETLEGQGVEMMEAQLAMVPRMLVPVDAETAKKLVRLTDALEELDDVQDVYTNADFPEDFDPEA